MTIGPEAEPPARRVQCIIHTEILLYLLEVRAISIYYMYTMYIVHLYYLQQIMSNENINCCTSIICLLNDLRTKIKLMVREWMNDVFNIAHKLVRRRKPNAKSWAHCT